MSGDRDYRAYLARRRGPPAMKLRTTPVYPPIPFRQFDWECASDDYEPYTKGEHSIVGRGATEFMAIVDWLVQWEPQ